MTVLPTSRAIRSRLQKASQSDSFLPSLMSMGEFLQRVILVEGLTRVDDDKRVLLLLEAADFSNFRHLQIERDFFTFIKNATFLFRFFEELSGELIDVGSLEQADTYGDYEEHISILQELYERYERICIREKVLDPIFLPRHYRPNIEYIRSLEHVEIIVEGYLTDLELEILLACSREIEVTLRLSANRFNKKMQQKLQALGVDVQEGVENLIDLRSLQVKEVMEVSSDVSYSCEAVSERLLQVAFIKQKVYTFIREGIDPEDIVVVLPDEEFASSIHRFDRENNFNLAMGISMKDSAFIQRLGAIMTYLDNPSVQNRARLERIGSDGLGLLSSCYRGDIEASDFDQIINAFLEYEEEASVRDIVLEELFYFRRLMPVLQGSTLKSALYLFMNRIKSKRRDDVRGGKITVMGLLETRSVAFEGVIVVDFNEDKVPRKSEKDLFLNSATRIKAGLPSAKDRESLQKLYYHDLFLHAKEVAISYVDSAESLPSRFLTQMGITPEKSHSDEQWADILFERHPKHTYRPEEVEGSYDFTSRPLSATGLKTFLTCKRKFYHHYVEALRSHELPKEMPEEHEIGTALHDALRDVYQQTPRFSDKRALKHAVSEALKLHNGKTPLDAYLHRIWLKRLDAFFDAEIERFEDVEVAGCEESLSMKVEGITLTGIVDRIDRTPDGYEVLDYKSGKYPRYTPKTVQRATDFQLEFYYLLASQRGVVTACGYYDLKSGKIVPETLLETKLESLLEHLRELRSMEHIEFSKTDDPSACRFCEYAYLCERAL